MIEEMTKAEAMEYWDWTEEEYEEQRREDEKDRSQDARRKHAATLSDQELMESIQVDENFEELYARHSADLLRYLSRFGLMELRLSGLAEMWSTIRRDGVNSVAPGGHRFEAKYGVRPFIYSMAANITINHAITHKRLARTFPELWEFDADKSAKLVTMVTSQLLDHLRNMQAVTPSCDQSQLSTSDACANCA